VFELRVHLVDLVLQALYLDLLGADLRVQLLDLVVKHELELFQLLDLFPQLLDADLLLL